MRIVRYSFETTLSMSEDVRSHDFLLRCRPTSNCGQTVLSAQVVVYPGCALAAQSDGFGNALDIGRIEEPHKTFSFTSTGLVVVDRAAEEALAPMPTHPIFGMPSRLAAADAAIAQFAREAAGGAGAAGTGASAIAHAAEALSHAVFERMTYEPGATTTGTTAAEAFAQGRGVCQDYAHVLIACLRACGIDARYVSGLMSGEGATHAWVEFYNGERWRGIDPTNNCFVTDDYLVIARGRDFADCPVESGVFRGGARQSQQVSVVVEEQ